MKPALSPSEAWDPLPAGEWNAAAAQHLLRRAGWSAPSTEVQRAVDAGLAATLDRLFSVEPLLLAKPRAIERLEDDAQAQAEKLRTAAGEARRTLERQSRERSQLAIQDLTIKWLQFAARPENAAFAKWVLFLSDVFVVSLEKVRNAAFIYDHFDILARHALGTAPALTKAVSRSTAMVIYLDLNQSQRRAPNENFARELFELFVLGEGNYTENDVKEAAKAFTGYRTRAFEPGFRYVAAEHDDSAKTIFGATGKFTGDDVIDLAYRQKAAGRFLPQEMVKFYLSDEALPAEHLATLGVAWSADGFSLRSLLHRFFGSRLFFTPELRGNFIKSPVQFYLGVMQDLQLDIAPLPRFTLNPLRQMGQQLYNPPNVRGWIGGRSWINSATLAARRQFVETLFAPLDERALNADELIELVAARTNGSRNFTVSEDHPLARFAALNPDEATERLVTSLLPGPVAAEFVTSVRQFLRTGPVDPKPQLRRLQRAAVAVLQSPEYQLC